MHNICMYIHTYHGKQATADKKTEPTDRLILRAQTPSALDEGMDRQGWQGLSVTVCVCVCVCVSVCTFAYSYVGADV